MSLKDEVEFVKSSLTGDEKILENAFKLEKLYKNNKKKIWAVIVLVVVGFSGNIALNAYQNAQLHSANDALLTLQKDPSDSSALDTLKSKNPKLYELYTYSQSFDKSDAKALEALSSSSDEILADLSKYNAAMLNSKTVDSKYYQEMVLVEEAYTALKDGKKDLAKQKLSLIGENSPISSVARLLKHYTISQSK